MKRKKIRAVTFSQFLPQCRQEVELRPEDVNAIGLNDEGFKSTFLNAKDSYDEYENHIRSVQGYSKKLDFHRSWGTCYPTFLFADERRATHLVSPTYAAEFIAGRMPTGGLQADSSLSCSV